MNSTINCSDRATTRGGKPFISTILKLTIPLFITALFISSCEDEITPIGADMLPDGDFAATFSEDTFAINMFTMYDDSVPSSEAPFYFRMGKYHSSYFGTTSAEFVTELNLISPWPGKGIESIDSAFLILRISELLGETEGPQYLQLRENDEQLFFDSVYYSNKEVQQGRLLALIELNDLKKDTLYRIPLSRTFGAYMLRDTSMLFISSSQPDFRTFFRGVWFKMSNFVMTSGDPDDPDDPGDPGDPDDPGDQDLTNPLMISLEPAIPASSGFMVYYTNKSGESRHFDFVLSDKSAKYARYIHNHDAADEGKKIENINNFVTDTMVYQQSLYGVYTRIELPGLEALKELGDVAVNKARLTIPVLIDDEEFTAARMPQRLLLRYTNSDGRKVFIPDVSISPDYFGGTYRTTEKVYTFNIAAFLQEYLAGRIAEPVMEIYTTAQNDKNVIMKANGASVAPKLEISLTKF